MNDDQIRRLCDLHGIGFSRVGGSLAPRFDDLREFVRSIQNEAYEHAAYKCLLAIEYADDEWGSGYNSACRECASEIRAAINRSEA